MKISEDTFYALNQLNNRLGFIYELAMVSGENAPAFKPEQILSTFSDLSETLQQIVQDINLQNEQQQTSVSITSIQPVDQA